MKVIKIHINKLGAVRESTVVIKPMMILSGESGLGKSYVAILVHYFYKFLAEERMQGFFDDKGHDYSSLVAANPNEGAFTINTDELTAWMKEDAKKYMCLAIGNNDLVIDVDFEVPFEKKEYTFEYKTVPFGLEGKEEKSHVFQLEELSMRVSLETGVKNIGSIPWSMLFQERLCLELLGGSIINQTFAMVPGRGSLLNVPITMQDRIKNNGDIFSEFLSDWYVVRSMPARKRVDKDLVDINGGKIELDENDNILYQIGEEKPLPISAAASSIKELAPLYMLLDKYPSNQLSILFEEPEAHLHPQKQVDIADFVVQAINKGAHMQITTHSDYFLRRLNDRIFLFKIFESNPTLYEETLKKYKYSDLTINPSLIGAYLLRREKDGNVKVIEQVLEKGIPYESFYNVIQNESYHSLDIQQTYFSISKKNA